MDIRWERKRDGECTWHSLYFSTGYGEEKLVASIEREDDGDWYATSEPLEMQDTWFASSADKLSSAKTRMEDALKEYYAEQVAAAQEEMVHFCNAVKERRDKTDKQKEELEDEKEQTEALYGRGIYTAAHFEEEEIGER